jgi:uncharacterized protein with PIN domain
MSSRCNHNAACFATFRSPVSVVRQTADPHSHAPIERWATLRFYEELNDFLPAHRYKRAFEHPFTGTPTVKDVVEALGVPHPEIDLILVNGVSVGFEHVLTGGERVAVYPVFERLDIGPVTRLRAKPLRVPRFVLDVHLGKLARYLRMLGFDTCYYNDYDDPELAAISVADRRILLTRDRGLLKRSAVTHGYWLRATHPKKQLVEVIQVFCLEEQLAPFTRCLRCNGSLHAVDKEQIRDQVPSGVRHRHDEFAQCSVCANVYWKGSHFDRMQALIRHLDRVP